MPPILTRLLHLCHSCVYAAAVTAAMIGSALADEVPSIMRRPATTKPAARPVPFAEEEQLRVIDDVSRYVMPPLDSTPPADSDLTKRRIIGTVREFPFDTLTLDTRAASDVNVGALDVIASGAARVRLHFEDFDLRDGLSVYVCSREDLGECYGPYQSRGPLDDGSFWTPPVTGDTVRVLVTRTGDSSGVPPALTISEISHTFPEGLAAMENAVGPNAGTCNLQVPSAWQFAAQSVGALDFISTPHEVFCTGTLLNSQAQDGTPYLLTANHCLDSSSEAQSLRVWWRFESAAQTLGSRPHSDVATLLATRTASSGSDYTLLMILGALPDVELTFAGWTTAMPAAATSIVGLHHPNGDGNDADAYTRYSIGTVITACPCGSGLGLPCGNAVSVDWNTNGGVTEPGSSGSALFLNNSGNAQLVGQLYGGCSACGNSNDDDHYGRFDLTYNHIGTVSSPHYLNGGRDDAFENNDTSLTATTLTAGTYNNLVVKSVDVDWYFFNVAANQTVTFTTSFTHAYGDVELELYKDAVFHSGSYGIGNSEMLQYTNNTGAAVQLYYRVLLASSTRNTYSVTVATTTASATVTLDASDTSATEAGPTTGTATVIRTGSTASPLSVNYTIGGTATNGSDYTTLTGTVTIAAGLASAPITVAPVNDSSLENAETVAITLATGTGYTIGSPNNATVTITDNDASITVVASDGTATESGQTTGTYTVSRNGSTAAGLTVYYTMSGAAANGTDYSSLPGSVFIPSGSSSADVILTPIGDLLAEGNESAVLSVSSDINYQVGSPASATVTIVDNFGPPSNVVATATSATSVQITWTAGAGAASYRVYRSTGGTFTVAGTPASSPFVDNVTPNSAYLYLVRSFSGTESVDSNIDLATTVVFTDTLSSGTAPVKAIHFTELLTAANALRALAGLGGIAFTAPSPGPGVSIRRQHVIDLRNGIDAARANLGMSAISYAEPAIVAGVTTVKASHLNELRNAVK